MNRWRIYANREDWNDSISLLILRDRFQGGSDSMDYVKGFELEKIDEGSYLADKPSLILPHGEGTEFLQAMVNVAWGLGIKPTAMESDANELKATRYHLEDMRKLAKVDRGN